MDNVAIFNIDEVVPLKDGSTMIVLSLVDDELEDEEVFPAIKAEKCPKCGDMVRDGRKHRCFW